MTGQPAGRPPHASEVLAGATLSYADVAAEQVRGELKAELAETRRLLAQAERCRSHHKVMVEGFSVTLAVALPLVLSHYCGITGTAAGCAGSVPMALQVAAERIMKL